MTLINLAYLHSGEMRVAINKEIATAITATGLVGTQIDATIKIIVISKTTEIAFSVADVVKKGGQTTAFYILIKIATELLFIVL